VRLLVLIAALVLPGIVLADGPIGPGDSKVEAPTDEARVYVYVDDGGQMHFVDRLDLVPAQYRDRVRETSLVTTQKQHEDAAGEAARKRRDARVEAARQARKDEMAARIKARDEAQQRANEDPSEAGEPETPPSKAEQLADALTERRELLEEFALLEEGYAEDAEQSEAQLIVRSETLEKRLSELDASISRMRDED
jgi:hypothetical protein